MIEEASAAAALLEPTRLRLVRELAAPDSASGLARRLGLPRQRVNYHLRALEKAGVVELVEERRRGNCVERIVQATARSYLISPDVLGAAGTDPVTARDRFSWAYLLSVAARAIRELALLRRRADRAGKGLPTLTLETEIRFASPAAQNAFAEDLGAALARLTSTYHDAAGSGGRTYRFFVGGYPRPRPDTATSSDESERE